MFPLLLATILGILLFLYSVYKFIEGNGDFWAKQGVPSVNPNDVNSFWDRVLFRIPFHVVELKLYHKLKAGMKTGTQFAGQVLFRHPVLFIMDLDLIRNILVKDFEYFTNRDIFDLKDPKIEPMLTNQINQEWKDLRGTMSPTFSTGKIKRMFGVFDESGNKMVQFLKQELLKPNGSSSIEMRNVCGRYTMDVIASAAFGVDSQNFENENSPFAINGRKIQDNFKPMLMLKFMFAMLLPKLAKYFKFRFFDEDAIDFLESVVKESIRRRKELGEKREDFLQLMMEAQNNQLKSDEKDEHVEDFERDAVLQNSGRKAELTDEVLIAQCNLFFFAGFDTIETLLMFAAYELALHPDCQERLFHELKEAALNNGGKLNYDTITQLKYLDMVVSEILRMYSPGVRLERKCNKDYKVPDSDYIIKKDTHIVIPVLGIHHDPELYPDPEQFDPERFTAENKALRHPYAFMPFGMGPRNCIGKIYLKQSLIATLIKLWKSCAYCITASY